MAPRRRFFPSTTAQKVPGRTVELEMQLRPEAPAAPPPSAGACEVLGAGWITTAWGAGEDIGNGRVRFGPSYDAHTVWAGTPAHVDDQGQALGVPGPQFHCVHMSAYVFHRPTAWHAVLQGTALTDAHWTYQWQNKEVGEPLSPASGCLVSSWGNVLLVLGPEYLSGTSGSELLTAWAWCGGQQVGEVTLSILTHSG